MKKFSEIKTRTARALQAWQILVSAAMNRQTHTYKSLSNLMFGHDATGVLGSTLGHIASFCNANDLPPLTAIVVNSKTGLPGDEIPVSGDLNAIREKVYSFDWYDVYPPSEDELLK
ncbi:hypothetical protein EIM44_09140 [Bibersteinia trehalosi]|uniref:Uncharacterized protein n=1 Tax=Bibersteinia trehalosi TaxID=47735 RepID=A0A426FFN8_BIBTR|nr:hypothetical protein [Bibersteinia trehalosi]RRN01677.1 hypothetical protein EIM44_09140 [Bibersteinia trehalosi]